MLANNETGVLFPIEEIGRIVREKSEAAFHVDGVQAVGKIPIDLKNTTVDLFALSGHKLHAPQGIGALYIRQGISLSPVDYWWRSGAGSSSRNICGSKHRRSGRCLPACV